MSEYVIGLQQVGASQLATAGGKGANLGELSRIGGIRVPGGFVVTTDAYAEVVGRIDSLNGLLDELSRLGIGAPAGIRAVSARLRAAIESAHVPVAIAEEVSDHIDDLGASDAYAVRSSATAEDLPTASFAGQQDTYLNLVGTNVVLAHVKKCWASLFTERAVTYRVRCGIDHRSVQLAVVVQRMVFPAAAGIMFTADPITSDRKTVSIDAGFGLGEALVSGLVNADNYTVRNGTIIRRSVVAQHLAVQAALGGGTEEVAIEPDRQSRQKLTDAHIQRLAGIGRTVEAHFGVPQDIEWALCNDTFFIVQSRPITTLFPVPGPQDGKCHVYMSFGHQQMMTDAMTPLGLSFFQAQFADTPLIEAGGRLYIDMAPDLASPLGRRIVQATMRSVDPLIDSGLQDLMRRRDFIKNLARDGQRYLKLNGGGYFTWRLPVEALKLYHSKDQNVVAALRAKHDATLDRVEVRLGKLSGAELFAAILHALSHEMKDDVIDPRSMGAVYVGMYALSWVNKHMAKWLGVKNAGDLLLTSVANDVTTDMGLSLLDVADTVRNNPSVLAALPTLTDDGFFAQLSAVDGGDSVGRSIKDFLRLYGMRCSGEIDITRPRWNEAPSTLVPMILSTIRNLEPNARRSRAERSRREADELEWDLLGRLERLPRSGRKAWTTRKMIRRLRNFSGCREYPKYLMMRHYWVMKQAMLTEAARLVDKAAIQRLEDVYFLSFEEFGEAVRTGALDRVLIDRRKEEFDAWQRLSPPRVITSDGEVPVGTYDLTRTPQGGLAGVGVSGGTVEGRARIIRNLIDADLTDGDILVTTFTDPSWTPIFLSAKGVVTEVGGAMTHGAVVAREYGLPAVVGVEGAMRLIKDGQRIRVNGTAGYVEFL